MNNNIILETRLIGNIEGDFYIKSYQRGYRWGSEEVERLLDDIYTNGAKSYCLQPIVVKRENDKLELIDGQQRITTIYLIYQYMHKKTGGWLKKPKFSIDYKTKENCKEFLDNIDMTKKNDNIDFYHLANAYNKIEEWFSSKEQSAITKFNEYLDDYVKIIWYEVDETVESIPLFTRLNIGKIPLTSSELVKAMFLSRNVNEIKINERQEEISLQWDNIDKELNNDKLWYFLTNNSTNNYKTKIDLILDLLTKKTIECREKYYTYFEIDKMRKNKSLQEIWNRIQHTFLILKDWFENHELYHKVGYLITSKYMSLQEIFEISQDKTKEEFINILNNKIKDSIRINKNYSECDYNNNKSYEEITRLLILFNIESVRKNGEQTQWFPFDKFKVKSNGKVVWSLEHIHAQNSEGMKTQEEWKEWLKWHLNSIITINSENKYIELIEKIKKCIERQNLDGITFKKLQEQILMALSVETRYNKDSIANLALLNSEDNSALNNSTFDVKRDKIIEMDQKGMYIPFCTRMVFLKYYTPSKDNQIHFWGQQDMEAYIDKINEVLEDYLDGNIIKFDMEGEILKND